MTSNTRPTVESCYIFVDQGPEPTLAAKYQIKNGIGSFTYGKSYAEREEAFSFDPINLPITSPLRVMNPSDGGEKFGVLMDATPDNWGRRLVTALHSNPPRNELEWMLTSKGTGAGCLVASLSSKAIKKNHELPSFEDLAYYVKYAPVFAEREGNSAVTVDMEKLLDFGSSMGGARPKTIVMDQGKEWIAKINRDDDMFNNARVEHATLRMAHAAGIKSCHSELREVGGHQILLVERFDRNCPERKKHYISAHSLINIPKIREIEFARDYSYMGIANVIKKIGTNPIENLHELYRRMAFNVLTGNTDDHLKNHGLLLTDVRRNQYELSPAFDLLPKPSQLGLQAIGCGVRGRESSIDNMLSAAPYFLLDPAEAKLIIEEVKTVTSEWQKYYDDFGISKIDQKVVSQSFELSSHAEKNSVHGAELKKPSNESNDIEPF